ALVAEARISKVLSKVEIATAMDAVAYLGQSIAIVHLTRERIRYAGASGLFGRRSFIRPVSSRSAAVVANSVSIRLGGFSVANGVAGVDRAEISGPAKRPSSRNHSIVFRIVSSMGRYDKPSSRIDFVLSIIAPVRRKSASQAGSLGGERLTRAHTSPVREASHSARPPICREGTGVPETALATRIKSPHLRFSPETMYRSPTRPFS